MDEAERRELEHHGRRRPAAIRAAVTWISAPAATSASMRSRKSPPSMALGMCDEAAKAASA